MLQLKRGTKVLIKDDLIANCRYGKESVNFSDEMEKYKGKILTISTKGLSDDVYRMQEDRGFYWDIAMFDIIPEEVVEEIFFKKEDLEVGMVVITRDGTNRMVTRAKGKDICLYDGTGGWVEYGWIKPDLTVTGPYDKKLDIMEIYDLALTPKSSLERSTRNRGLLWKRQAEKKVVSMDEIAQKFGVAVSELNVIK